MAENKKITLNQFKSWLEGVEEMQDDTWVPSATQWKRIRDKINDIEEVSQPPQPLAIPDMNYSGMVPAGLVSDAPVQFATPGMIPTGRLPSGPAAPPSSNPLFANPDTPTVPARTPTIDTSNGNYQSMFA